MYNFLNDYNSLCHPKVVKELLSHANQKFIGYGDDHYCKTVRDKIRKRMNNKNGFLAFVTGGTQANLIVIASILKPYEGVVSADTGHINTHETGAIEATGHKVITIPNNEGKLNPEDVRKVFKDHHDDGSFEHIVKPGMVYISNPTELGTIYTKKELESLHKVCKDYDVPLFIDGARLASAIDLPGKDLKFTDLANVCDVLYIGGTKCGTLCGECIVINNDTYKKDFKYHLKQRGARLAKTFSIAIQFDALFTDDLYFELGQYSNDLAAKVYNAVKHKYKTYVKFETNQLFLVLDNEKINELSKKYLFHTWAKVSENETAIRLCFSWSTNIEEVDSLIKDILK